MEVNGTRSVRPFHSEQFLSTRGDVMCTFYSPMTSAMLFCAPLSSYTASACSEYFVRCRCALLRTTSRPPPDFVVVHTGGDAKVHKTAIESCKGCCCTP